MYYLAFGVIYHAGYDVDDLYLECIHDPTCPTMGTMSKSKFNNTVEINYGNPILWSHIS